MITKEKKKMMTSTIRTKSHQQVERIRQTTRQRSKVFDTPQPTEHSCECGEERRSRDRIHLSYFSGEDTVSTVSAPSRVFYSLTRKHDALPAKCHRQIATYLFVRASSAPIDAIYICIYADEQTAGATLKGQIRRSRRVTHPPAISSREVQLYPVW